MTDPTSLPSRTEKTRQMVVVKPGFHSIEGFKFLKEMATIFSNSHMVPANFRAAPANALIACELSCRLGMSPLQIMQNIYIVNGKPSWSSQFLISLWNSCGRFTPIRYEWFTDGPNRGCRAYSTELSTGQKLVGTTVTMKMAEAEGWTNKSGSKWKTMPEQMFMYRAAAFLVRSFAPELTLGMHTADELEDTYGVKAEEAPFSAIAQANQAAASQPTIEEVIENVIETDGANEVSAVMDSADSSLGGSPELSENQQAEPVIDTTRSGESVAAVQPVAVNESQPQAAQVSQSQTEATDNPAVSRETLLSISELLKEVNPPKEVWSKLLQSIGVDKASLLTESDAGRVVGWLRRQKQKIEEQAWAASAAQTSGGSAAIAAGFSA